MGGRTTEATTAVHGALTRRARWSPSRPRPRRSIYPSAPRATASARRPRRSSLGAKRNPNPHRRFRSLAPFSSSPSGQSPPPRRLTPTACTRYPYRPSRDTYPYPGRPCAVPRASSHAQHSRLSATTSTDHHPPRTSASSHQTETPYPSPSTRSSRTPYPHAAGSTRSNTNATHRPRGSHPGPRASPRAREAHSRHRHYPRRGAETL